MNPSAPRLLRVAPVADVPVLWATLARLDLPATPDRHFPTPAPWKGPLTPGEVLAVWRLFLVSQGDHCLNHVPPGVAQPQGVLSALRGKPVLPTHAHDDRLADGLTRLSRGDGVAARARDRNRRTGRVYQRPTALVRRDAPTAHAYAAGLSAQGLLPFGPRTGDPGRPQVTSAAAVLDPLGLPLVTAVGPGTATADPLYVPAIPAARQALGVGGRTYGGDCTMAALAPGAFVAAGGDFYLCPLSENPFRRAQRRAVVQAVWDGTPALPPGWRPGPNGPPAEVVAEGFAVEGALTAPVGAPQVHRAGRRWLVRSQASAPAQAAARGRRRAKAEAALRDSPTRTQGKQQLVHAERVRAAEAIVAREGGTGLRPYTAPARRPRRPGRA